MDPEVKAGDCRSESARPRLTVLSALLLCSLVVAGGLLWLIGSRLPARMGRELPERNNTPEALVNGNAGRGLEGLPDLVETRQNLSADDVAFGEQQLQQMAKDRPEMGRYVKKDDAVWQFCAWGFGGGVIGERIYWETNAPLEGYQCDHTNPYMGKRASIRIRLTSALENSEGQPLACEELWECAVYELENIRNCRAFDALFERALKGRLSREDWIRGNTRLEYGAWRRTAARYDELWRPMADARGVASSGDRWGTNTPAAYEEWISRYIDPNSYPWDVYGAQWDRDFVPYLRRR